MEANPTLIIKASVILAAKIEEFNYENQKVYKELGIDQKSMEDKLIDYEMRILKSLDFSLSFISLGQVVKFLIKEFEPKIQVSLNKQKMYIHLLKYCSTDSYFLVNPIQLVLYIFYEQLKNEMTEVQFFEVLVGLNIPNIVEIQN